ncbi:nucleotidyltransferase family protein [Desulforamulus putei]|uniref:CBS domain-containing protein n=1 Tax=Desulforamulus putei DSM 12395 TaxID=1121429 RepID=A0A1M5AZ85_9FIRM|nr:nucleotidyltransferase family protein [Desulforamulus putei]SHF35242.1 CBS domain-containing protein [Desulforamulus putei DSM 12395]
MRSWKDVLVSPCASILNTIKVIDSAALQIALVVDDAGRLLGTVTDGDIRRAILRGLSLDEPVSRVMNSSPTVARVNEDRQEILAVMKARNLRHIPVLDETGRVVGIEILEELLKGGRKENLVVLMAGGLGSRLRPLTQDCPKPLLKVGSRPILETILHNFIEYGFERFYISVNYKADMIKQYFGNGNRWNVQIKYIEEKERLGTAGSLSLLPEKTEHPLLIMNGDLLTRVNFDQLLSFHIDNQVQATMCVREFDLQVPFGVVKIDGHRLLGIDEKPVQHFFVNAGIYVLQPDVLELLPRGMYYDMPDLLARIVEQGKETAVFPVREYWLDIGRLSDYEQANGEYEEIFGAKGNVNVP